LDKWDLGVALPPHAEGMQIFAVFLEFDAKESKLVFFYSEIKIN